MPVMSPNQRQLWVASWKQFESMNKMQHTVKLDSSVQSV